jgi:hypothetical protein
LLLVTIDVDCGVSKELGFDGDIFLTSPRSVTLGDAAIAAVTSGANSRPLVVAGIRKLFTSRAVMADALPVEDALIGLRRAVTATDLGINVGDDDRTVVFVDDANVGFM